MTVPLRKVHAAGQVEGQEQHRRDLAEPDDRLPLLVAVDGLDQVGTSGGDGLDLLPTNPGKPSTGAGSAAGSASFAQPATGRDGGQPPVEFVVSDGGGGGFEVEADEHVGIEQRDQLQAGRDAFLAIGQLRVRALGQPIPTSSSTVLVVDLLQVDRGAEDHLRSDDGDRLQVDLEGLGHRHRRGEGRVGQVRQAVRDRSRRFETEGHHLFEFVGVQREHPGRGDRHLVLAEGGANRPGGRRRGLGLLRGAATGQQARDGSQEFAAGGVVGDRLGDVGRVSSAEAMLIISGSRPDWAGFKSGTFD